MAQPLAAKLFRIVCSINTRISIENGQINPNLNKACLQNNGNFDQQKFYLTFYGGTYAINTKFNHYTLKLSPFGDGLDGEQIVFGVKTGNVNQRWVIHENRFGGVSIMSDLNGKYLTVRNSISAGQQVVIEREEKDLSSWKFMDA